MRNFAPFFSNVAEIDSNPLATYSQMMGAGTEGICRRPDNCAGYCSPSEIPKIPTPAGNCEHGDPGNVRFWRNTLAMMALWLKLNLPFDNLSGRCRRPSHILGLAGTAKQSCELNPETGDEW